LVVNEVGESSWNAPAPGELELVRRFLNTWKIPNDTRVPTDLLPGLVRDPAAWAKEFPDAPLGPADAEELLIGLRDELRGILGEAEGWVDKLNRWLERYPLVARIRQVGGEASVSYEPLVGGGFLGRILAVVVRGVDEGTFSRLKACPDCRWVFYDRSRSRTRVWCGMLAGDGGRACGTIAKVRRYRQRQRGGSKTA
jgi:predicted RNA-binding Zn ribbon-like protein